MRHGFFCIFALWIKLLYERLKEVDATYTCHLGRRSYASFLANRNVSTAAIAAALGDSPAVTVRYYAKYLTTTAIKEQIKVLETP